MYLVVFQCKLGWRWYINNWRHVWITKNEICLLLKFSEPLVTRRIIIFTHCSEKPIIVMKTKHNTIIKLLWTKKLPYLFVRFRGFCVILQGQHFWYGSMDSLLLEVKALLFVWINTLNMWNVPSSINYINTFLLNNSLTTEIKPIAITNISNLLCFNWMR